MLSRIVCLKIIEGHQCNVLVCNVLQYIEGTFYEMIYTWGNFLHDFATISNTRSQLSLSICFYHNGDTELLHTFFLRIYPKDSAKILTAQVLHIIGLQTKLFSRDKLNPFSLILTNKFDYYRIFMKFYHPAQLKKIQFNTYHQKHQNFIRTIYSAQRKSFRIFISIHEFKARDA